MKTCSRCGEEKPFGDFYRETASVDGRCRWCKACMTIASRKYRATPAYQFGSYRQGAKRRGVEFTLTVEDFEYWWNQPCSYCGGPIEGIGLDRLDNAEGYVLGNVLPCCTTCNGMKSNLGLLEFIERCHRIAERLYLGVETREMVRQ